MVSRTCGLATLTLDKGLGIEPVYRTANPPERMENLQDCQLLSMAAIHARKIGSSHAVASFEGELTSWIVIVLALRDSMYSTQSLMI